MTRALARVFAIYQPSPERVDLGQLQPPKKGAKNSGPYGALQALP
jgi:hypothetical protein